MSKKFIALILALTLLPIGIFLFFNRTQTGPQLQAEQVSVPTATSTKTIQIPKPGTTGSTSQQCAVCALITDTGSKEQCMRDFACAL